VSVLWPRLTASVAAAMYIEAGRGALMPADSHPAQIYAPVGGRRATLQEVADLASSVRQLAEGFGFPDRSEVSARIAFDRAAAPLIRSKMDLSWSEAAARDVWSFLALVALPDITSWRFGTDNSERWVASDPNRHTWSRLWWHAIVFEGDLALLTKLTESDLNQLLERRRIGGDPRLARAIARAVVSRTASGEGRREIIRDVTARVRRRLAWADMYSLEPNVLDSVMSGFVEESIQRIGQS